MTTEPPFRLPSATAIDALREAARLLESNLLDDLVAPKPSVAGRQLPAVADGAMHTWVQTEAARSSAPAGPYNAGHQALMRILLIEDNAKLAQTIKTSLEQHGYSVDVTCNMRDGDEAAMTDHHDVVILDVMLPDGDGVQLCRQLRRQKVATPILMLSALDSTRQKIAGLDAGADDYLTKPFETDELLARLRSLLRRSQATEGALLESGSLVMDLQEHQVSRSGVAIKLSAKEFALLEYMMRNPRRLLTRSMISESVWDMNYEASSNVIDVYISSLRRKIDRGVEHPHIETVIGSGYRFLDPPEAADTPAASKQ